MADTEEKKPAKKTAKESTKSSSAWSEASERAVGASKKLVIFGQGEATHPSRKLQALRLRESLIERLAGVAGGPLYLLIEVALERLITELEQSEGMQAIDAKSLKD